jgi:hypothetical protein
MSFMCSITLIRHIVDPMIKRLTTSWERAFQTRLPKAFNTYVTNSGKIIHKFHGAVEVRACENGVGLANRDFTPTIAVMMHTVYDTCTVECGAGQYKGIKEFTRDHVEHARHHMIHERGSDCGEASWGDVQGVQESMEAKADEIFVQMNRDYMRVLGGAAADQPI